MISLCFEKGLPEARRDFFRQLLAQYRAAFVETSEPEVGIYLFGAVTGLGLMCGGKKGVVRVDFSSGAATWRRQKGGGEMIARAVDIARNRLIVDATGGLGRDAFVLACAGAQVKICEKNPIVAALLADGIDRATQNHETIEIVSRMRLQAADALDVLSDTEADVVYLDPMYPQRQKSAAVKKEMAYFHELVGLPETGEDIRLLESARHAARRRVVVKRPAAGVFLGNERPAYQYAGKSTRFDVYLPFRQPVTD